MDTKKKFLLFSILSLIVMVGLFLVVNHFWPDAVQDTINNILGKGPDSHSLTVTVNDEKMCVDKDILVKGNKLYSPKTCCIVPETINMLFTNRKRYRGELPVGVTFKNGKYMAKFKRNGRDFYLGYYDSANDAFANYKYAKESYIRTVAKKYQAWIPQKVFDALMNYKIEITD